MVKFNLDTEELIENWTLVPQELELVKKKIGAGQMGFAIFLKYFQLMARFPDDKAEIPEQVIYPVVSQKTLRDLVAEYKATGTAYRQRVHTVMRSSFASHYRRMIPLLLEILEFRSNNDIHRPVIQALELLKKYAHSKAQYYDTGEDIPISGVLKSGWKEILLETDFLEKERINRSNYEISVLQSRERKTYL